MQHTNAGSGAAKVTEILLTIAAIGLPMVFVCNYRMAHKLLGRNSEDKQRLLTDPRIMLPDDPGSTDWLNYVAQCIRVSNGFIKADAGELALELYHNTFGIKRLVVLLLKLAYVECRNAGRQCVNPSNVTRAYRSAVYTASAGEVEEFQLQALSHRKKQKRMDSPCPFDLPDALKSNVFNFARANRSERVTATGFHSSLTEKERAAVKVKEDRRYATRIVPPRHRAAVTNLTEERKESAFREYMDNLAPPKLKDRSESAWPGRPSIPSVYGP